MTLLLVYKLNVSIALHNLGTSLRDKEMFDDLHRKRWLNMKPETVDIWLFIIEKTVFTLAGCAIVIVRAYHDCKKQNK